MWSVCVCVCARWLTRSQSNGLQCPSVLPLVRPRVDLFIAHFYCTPSPPSPLVNPPARLTAISNPAGIPLLNYPSSHPSRHLPIHPSIPHSPCDVYLLSYTFIYHAAPNCFPPTLHACAFCDHSGESYLTPFFSCPVFPFFPVCFSLWRSPGAHCRAVLINKQ